MTRKRFIKKMMALDYSRNEANERATRARRYGQSYAARWEHERNICTGETFLDGLQSGLAALACACETIVKKLPGIVEAAKKMAAAFVAVTSVYKLDPAGDAMEPEPMWTKENPHLDGLRIHHSFVDELAASGPTLTQAQIDATTPAKKRILIYDGKLVNQDAFVTISPVAGGDADGN